MRHLGQVAEAPEPAHLVARVGVDHGVDPLRRAQRDDRFAQRLALLLEGGDRGVVAVERLAVGAELDVGVGHGDARLERRGVADVAAGELEPGHERELGILERIGGPAEAEQRLVRLQALQPHPLEVAARRLRVAFGQRGEAEGDVGAVAQGAELLVLGRHAADVVEDRHAAGDAARRAVELEQGDAEVVAGVARAARLERHAVQDRRPRRCSRRAPSAGWPGAGSAPPAGPRAGCPRPGRARSRPRAGSRAGSGSWRGRTRPGRAPSARCSRSAGRRSAPIPWSGRTTAACRRAGSPPPRRGARPGRSAARPSASSPT